MVNKIYINFTPFHVATEKSTAAPGEETTAALPGKTTNNMEKGMKRLFLNFLEFFNVLPSVRQLWNIQFG